MSDSPNDPFDARYLPSWVPSSAVHYLAHTENGMPIRELARQADVHASTILRQVRRFEQRRDDPLVDGALRRLSKAVTITSEAELRLLVCGQGSGRKVEDLHGEETEAMKELRLVLRRLSETGSILAVARDMEVAVIMREMAEGEAQRTGTASQAVAQALALKEWIASDHPDKRIARYRITASGRAALKDMILTYGTRRDARAGQFADAGARFEPAPDPLLHHMRNSMTESPLAGLARRKDKSGKAFIGSDLLRAGERLREDFELSALAKDGGPDWLSFLETEAETPPPATAGTSKSCRMAQERVANALLDLGPGLGDVALMVCCYLEGMEQLEKRMGWSARSGKIVLRIALQRLSRHYSETQGEFGPMIG